ncbi:MAG: PqqD family protein [Halobacteriovoraceae bacterium]|nr:PqqD family protein [Halobacteriovoraceae bacterium]
MQFIQSKKIPAIPDDVISRVNDNKEIIIISMNIDDQFYKLDGVSSEIWSSIDGKKNWQQILKPLLEKYDVSKKQLNSDVKKLVTDLQKHSLIAPGTKIQ